MNKTVLEQALEHLLNKEEDKASSLLHDYYVSIGRRVYEDIMSDDVNQFEDEQALEDAADAVDEVDADLLEDEAEEAAPGEEEEATTDVADDMGAAPESAPVDSDAADVADAMVDVESALAKLKAEFEEMLTGVDADGDHEAGESGETEHEDHSMESIDESADLEKVAAPDNSDKADGKNSPVAGKNPTGARPAVKFGGAASGEGVASGTSPAKAPKAQDLGGTSKPSLKKV